MDVLLVAAIGCLIAAIVGGGVQFFNAQIPELRSIRRQVMLAALGAVLLLASGWDRITAILTNHFKAASIPSPPLATTPTGPVEKRAPIVLPETVAEAKKILEAQTLLIRMLYYNGPRDGVLGNATIEALREFQIYRGLPVTGKPDQRTLKEMRAVVSQHSLTQ